VTPEPETLARGADGLFRAEAQVADPLATVTPGALEGSNVDPGGSLIELIEQARRFELQTKLLTAAREMDEGTAALMRLD
jgi:flagellar basal-body rod protein FlgF